MGASGLGQVSVWLDELAPEGAFAHALEWASQLRVPLQAVVGPTPERSLDESGNKEFDRLAERLESCAAVCRSKGVSWKTAIRCEKPMGRMEQLFGPDRLGVFGSNLPLPLKEKLLRWAQRCGEGPVLIASLAWQPVSRVLVLHELFGPDDSFLDSVADLCRTFRASPVVLTVAGTEAKARQGQRRAQEDLAQHRLEADFDFLVGGDLRVGIPAVARWRQCSHVIVPQLHAAPWWRWFRRGIIGHLLRWPDSLSVLVLPPACPLSSAPADLDYLEPAHTPRK
jgi:hypothetical protein